MAVMLAAGAPPAAPHPLVGTYIGVKCCVAGPVEVHVRFIAAPVDPLRPLAFVTVSPDGDEYDEDYSDAVDFE